MCDVITMLSKCVQIEIETFLALKDEIKEEKLPFVPHEMSNKKWHQTHFKYEVYNVLLSYFIYCSFAKSIVLLPQMNVYVTRYIEMLRT